MNTNRFNPPTTDQQVLISEDKTMIIVKNNHLNSKRIYSLVENTTIDPSKKIKNSSISGESTEEGHFFNQIMSALELLYPDRFVEEVLAHGNSRIRERTGIAQQLGGVGPFVNLVYENPSKLELIVELNYCGPFPLQWTSTEQNEALVVLDDLSNYLNTQCTTTSGWSVNYQAIAWEENVNLLIATYTDQDSLDLRVLEYLDYAERIAGLFQVVPDITHYSNFKESIIDNPHIVSLWKKED